MGQPFVRIIPHLIGLMNAEKEEVQQRGAELVAMSLISDGLFENQQVQEMLEALLEKSMNGSAPHRRGIARVFSNNLLNNPRHILIDGLYRLMNDEDEDVQRQVGFFLYNIKEKKLGLSEEVLTIISALAESKSIVHNGHSLGSILWEKGGEYPAWTISTIRCLLKNNYLLTATERHSIDSKDLFHAIMNIYTDPFSDNALQTQAIDTFDRLMELYSLQAQSLLAEWDRRYPDRR